MKADDIAKQKAKDWLILGGKLVTRILKDTDKGISQDGDGFTKDFPPYSKKGADVWFRRIGKGDKRRTVFIDSYLNKKKKGRATPKGVQANKQVSPPNLRLTGVLLNSLKAQSATSNSVELNYRDGLKFEGNAKNGRNVYGLNDKNETFVKEYFEKIIDDRIVKFSKKDIIIDLNV